MKIAIINNLFIPYERGGAEKIAKLQFDGLVRAGHDVITISLRPYFKNIDDPNHHYLPSLFSNLEFMPKPFRLFWHLLDMFDFINYFKIKNILKKNNIEAVITHNICGIGKTIIPHLKKYKHIHVLHDISLLHPSGLMFYKEEGIIDTGFAKIYQLMNGLFFNEVKNIISPSKWLLDLHKQKKIFKDDSNSVVIPNPIGNKKNQVINKIKNKKVTFLFVGLVSKHKGIFLLIEAWKKIKSSLLSQAELILIGQLYDNAIKEIITSTEGVSYLGKKDSDTVSEYMNQADCLIVPSICYENSPTVIYEAYSKNLPVLASRLGGNIELIEKFGGLLFVPDIDQLTGQLENIIVNPSILNASSKNVGIEDMDIHRYTDRLFKILEQIS